MEEETRADGVYVINGKRKLYWQEDRWYEAIYHKERYTGNIRVLEKQPKTIKSIEKINANY